MFVSYIFWQVVLSGLCSFWVKTWVFGSNSAGELISEGPKCVEITAISGLLKWVV
jgi:hypothetical protein